MSDQDIFIFDVSKNNFNTSVILNSYKMPVVVEFMAVWSEPCFHVADSLSSLSNEFPGQFIFAKADIEEQEELKTEYDIKNMPTIKVFKDGEVVRSEEGMMSNDELRALLKDFSIFRQSDEKRAQARQQHIAGNTMQAVTLLTEAIKADPSDTYVAMDMIQIMLDVNQLEQAKMLYNKLPDSSKNSEVGKTLFGQLNIRDLASKTLGITALQENIIAQPDDNDAHFDLSICLIAEHNYQLAMEHLFIILGNDATYKNGAAREMIINLCNILTPNEPELSHQYRQKLANIANL